MSDVILTALWVLLIVVVVAAIGGHFYYLTVVAPRYRRECDEQDETRL